MALRCHANDYIRDAEIRLLREDVNIIMGELFSRDESFRLSSLQSFGSLGGLSEHEVSERITRYNLITTMANCRVNTQMGFAEVFPKFNSYGELPREFERPKRMEEFLQMEVTTVDYILQSYNLSRDLEYLRRPGCLIGGALLSRERVGLSSAPTLVGASNDRYRLNRDQKLLILFEYLGVDISTHRRNGLLGNLGGLEGGFGSFGSRLSGGLSGGLSGSAIGGRGLVG